MRLLAFAPSAVLERDGQVEHVIATVAIDEQGQLVVTLELDDETTATLVMPAESVNQAEGGLETGRAAA